MNDVIHEIISMSNDETIYDQYKNSEIKNNNETNDVQNDKKQDNSLDAKNKSVDSRIANENSISNIIVNTEIDNNKDSDNDKPIDVADINANKEKLKSVNKRLLNKQMYNNKILDAITPISHNINNKLGQEVMTCDASSDISPVNAQNVNKYNHSFKFITKTNMIITLSIVICIMFIFAILFIARRNKTTKFDIISNVDNDNEHNMHELPDYNKEYKQFGTKINDSINGGINGGKKTLSKTLPKRDNKGRFIKS